MKRALIHNPYWDSLGGGERYVATFIELLLNEGWSVDLDWSQDISSQIQDRFNIDISKSSYILHPKSSIYDLVFWVSDGSLPISFAKKTIVHFQIPFQNVNGHGFANLIKSRFYTFVSNSNFTKKVVDKEFGINSKVVYPPVGVENFSPSSKKTKNIVYVGRFSNLTQSKGQEYLIGEFTKISKSIPGWKLVLAGGTLVGTTPEYLSKLKDLAKDYPIEFVLDSSFSKIKSLLETAQIFWSASGFSPRATLSPDKQEHFGISLVEAMAAGCVPIVPNLGGHPEIIDHDSNGLLYDSLDQMENLTIELIKDKDRLALLSKNAIQKSKLFSKEVFNDNFKKII